MEWNPVDGRIDGRTYGNMCTFMEADVKLDNEGECGG